MYHSEISAHLSHSETVPFRDICWSVSVGDICWFVPFSDCPIQRHMLISLLLPQRDIRTCLDTSYRRRLDSRLIKYLHCCCCYNYHYYYYYFYAGTLRWWSSFLRETKACTLCSVAWQASLLIILPLKRDADMPRLFTISHIKEVLARVITRKNTECLDS